MDSNSTRQAMMSLPQAGARLSMTWSQTYNAILRGKLRGEQREGRWFVDVGSVESLERDRTARSEGAMAT